jgi:hypothetical protein
MSAGNSGAGMPPEHDDDPFAYLYRPEGGQPGDGQGQQPPARPPRQPSSYHQVRPVGERTFGGQRPRQGYGYPQPSQQQPQQQPQPDAYYAAPETQPGGPGGPAGRRRTQPPEPPRRNGLLIGAIAVVLAVVVGVGAAILFSGDDSDTTAGDDPSGSETQDTGGGDGGNGEESPSGEESTPPEDGELPAADLAALQYGGGAAVSSGVEGARSQDGSYVQGLASGSTITWTFDLQGEAGTYWLYTTYSAISDGQTLDFSLNGTPRDDAVQLDDYNDNSDEYDSSWTYTFNLVDLQPGENTIQYTCSSSCDVLVDQIFLADHELTGDEAP